MIEKETHHTIVFLIPDFTSGCRSKTPKTHWAVLAPPSVNLATPSRGQCVFLAQMLLHYRTRPSPATRHVPCLKTSTLNVEKLWPLTTLWVLRPQFVIRPSGFLVAGYLPNPKQKSWSESINHPKIKIPPIIGGKTIPTQSPIINGGKTWKNMEKQHVNQTTKARFTTDLIHRIFPWLAELRCPTLFGSARETCVRSLKLPRCPRV